jgi:hypothetical protein
MTRKMSMSKMARNIWGGGGQDEKSERKDRNIYC